MMLAQPLPSSATNTGCLALARVHRLQFAAPPCEQPKTFGRVADFIAQIVGPAAERIDVVEILMQALGQQKADDVEIFVVMGRQPARVGSALLRGDQARFIASGDRQEMQWDRGTQSDPALYGNDGGLQVAVVAHQVLHHFQQIRERLHAIHEILGGDIAPADDVQRLADQRRRVMEAGLAASARNNAAGWYPG